MIAYWNRTRIMSKAEPIRYFSPRNFKLEPKEPGESVYLTGTIKIQIQELKFVHISPSDLEEQRKLICRKNKECMKESSGETQRELCHSGSKAKLFPEAQVPPSSWVQQTLLYLHNSSRWQLVN